jgi:N-acetyl-anhydromuramyl-L-alanine amidase AmpD
MARLKTEFIVVHCTATPEGRYHDVASITAMHLAGGFRTIGYHYLIGLKGEIWTGRGPDNTIGAHVVGYNNSTLGIAYVGGVERDGKTPKDTRTPEQRAALAKIVRRMVTKYPKALVLGHRDLSPDLDHDGVVEPHEWIKACPCFSARAWARETGLPAAPGEPGLKLTVISDRKAFPTGA